MILLIDITPINFIKTVSKVYMERQKNRQHNVKEEEHSWRTDTIKR